METRLLLTTQKNEILKIVRKLELNPLDFIFIQTESKFPIGCTISKMVHKKTGYYFTFDFSRGSPNERWIEYFPTAVGTNHFFTEKRWDIIIRELYIWLNVVKRETTTEDSWQNISAGMKILESASAIVLTNDFFQPQEQENISAELDKIKNQLIETYKLTNQTRRFVEERFDYLDESVKRLGYKDWIHTAIGVSFTIAGCAVGIAPDVAKEMATVLWSFISRSLAGEPFLLQ